MSSSQQRALVPYVDNPAKWRRFFWTRKLLVVVRPFVMTLWDVDHDERFLARKHLMGEIMRWTVARLGAIYDYERYDTLHPFSRYPDSAEAPYGTQAQVDDMAYTMEVEAQELYHLLATRLLGSTRVYIIAAGNGAYMLLRLLLLIHKHGRTLVDGHGQAFGRAWHAVGENADDALDLAGLNPLLDYTPPESVLDMICSVTLIEPCLPFPLPLDGSFPAFPDIYMELDLTLPQTLPRILLIEGLNTLSPEQALKTRLVPEMQVAVLQRQANLLVFKGRNLDQGTFWDWFDGHISSGVMEPTPREYDGFWRVSRITHALTSLFTSPLRWFKSKRV